jgi:polyferredoxin
MHIVYALMMISAVFFGAAWCSYICPFGALQDLLPDKGKKPRLMKSKALNLKFITGALFLILILLPIIQYGFKDVIIFYHMEDTKVTLDSMHGLILYYIITGSIILICAIFGKRVWCRYFCPMYILNYIGIQISKILKFPRLKIYPDSSKCMGCHKCTDACIMGLKVADMVKSNKWNYNECIQCGECINTCKVGALKREFRLETMEMNDRKNI